MDSLRIGPHDGRQMLTDLAPGALATPSSDKYSEIPRHVARLPRWIAAGLIAVGVLMLLAFALRAILSPNIRLLLPHGKAKWIIYPTPADAMAYFQRGELSTEFRRTLVADGQKRERLLLWAFKRASVAVNGEQITPATVGKNWKDRTTYDLRPALKAGTNILSVTVFSDGSLPALAAVVNGNGVEIGTDEEWTSSFVGSSWRPAQFAEAPLPIRPGNPLYSNDSPRTALAANAGFIALFAVIGLLLFLARKLILLRSETNPAFQAKLERLPWYLLGFCFVAWGALWCNNLGYLPFLDGYDVEEHMKYIDYILKRHALPLASEGFQMYQPPLYYVIAAGLLSVIKSTPFDANGIFVLRLFGLCCGLASLTFAFLTSRLVFRQDQGRQTCALCMAALMAPNLYLCQYITNEILNTAVMSAAFYLCVRTLLNEELSLRQHVLTGALLGLAMLSKASSIVLAAVAFAALAVNLWVRGQMKPSALMRYICVPAMLMLVVCGWHYYRATSKFGTPFITNLDPAAGFNTWQEPGFLTPATFLFSGRSLVHPYFSGFASAPDLLYSTWWGDGLWGGMVRTASRPPWNYDLMSAGYWLALIPTFLFLAGVAQAFWRLIRKPNVLDMQNVGLLFLTGLFLYEVAFKASAYSSPKAFYASGMMVVVCLFAASGWAWITRLIPVSRPILAVGLTIWGLAIFCSFWIRPSGTQTRMRIVRGLAAQDLNDSAIQKALAYLRSDPANPELNQLLCHILIEGGQIEPVKKIIAAYFNGNDYRWWFVKARAAALEKNYDEAISCARTSLQLAPDYNYANYQLAAWLQVAGRKEEALVAGKEAVRVMPFSSESHAMLAKIASELGDEQEAAFHNRLVPILR